MHRFRRRLIVLALALACPGMAAGQAVAIVGGEVHTGSGEVLAGATVVIEGGTITAVGAGVEVPEGAEVIAAEGMVVTPGFIDAQTFLGSGPTAGGALINLVGEAGDAIARRSARWTGSPRTWRRCGSSRESPRSIWPPIRGC